MTVMGDWVIVGLSGGASRARRYLPDLGLAVGEFTMLSFGPPDRGLVRVGRKSHRYVQNVSDQPVLVRSRLLLEDLCVSEERPEAVRCGHQVDGNDAVTAVEVTAPADNWRLFESPKTVLPPGGQARFWEDSTMVRRANDCLELRFAVPSLNPILYFEVPEGVSAMVSLSDRETEIGLWRIGVFDLVTFVGRVRPTDTALVHWWPKGEDPTTSPHPLPNARRLGRDA